MQNTVEMNFINILPQYFYPVSQLHGMFLFLIPSLCMQDISLLVHALACTMELKKKNSENGTGSLIGC